MKQYNRLYFEPKLVHIFKTIIHIIWDHNVKVLIEVEVLIILSCITSDKNGERRFKWKPGRNIRLILNSKSRRLKTDRLSPEDIHPDPGLTHAPSACTLVQIKEEADSTVGSKLPN